MMQLKSQQQQIEELKQEVAELKQALLNAGLLNKWLRPKQAAQVLGESEWVLRAQIRKAIDDPKNSNLKVGKHFRVTSSNRYLINVDTWQRLQETTPDRRAR